MSPKLPWSLLHTAHNHPSTSQRPARRRGRQLLPALPSSLSPSISVTFCPPAPQKPTMHSVEGQRPRAWSDQPDRAKRSQGQPQGAKVAVKEEAGRGQPQPHPGQAPRKGSRTYAGMLLGLAEDLAEHGRGRGQGSREKQKRSAGSRCSERREGAAGADAQSHPGPPT